MLSGTLLKQFRTYLKSQVGHGWSAEGRKSKRRYLTRVSFRYISGERSVAFSGYSFYEDIEENHFILFKAGRVMKVKYHGEEKYKFPETYLYSK